MKIYGNIINCEPSDLPWIRSQVDRIPHKYLVPGVIHKYNKVFEEAKNSGLTHQGEIRRLANTKLRIYVGRVLESMK